MKIYEHEENYFTNLRYLIRTQLTKDVFLDWFDDKYSVDSLIAEYEDSNLTLKDIIKENMNDFYNHVENNLFAYDIYTIEVNESEG